MKIRQYQQNCIIIQIIVNDFTITAYAQLYCDQKQTDRNVIQSFLYIGSVLGLFIMNMLSDTKGRKFSFVISLAIANVGITLLIIGAYYKVIIIMAMSQVIIGFGGYSVMIIGYTLLSDLCQDKMRQIAILSMNGVWALTQASLFIFYNWYNDWFNYLLIVVLIPSIGLLLFSVYFLIETPVFLLTKKHNKEECIASLKKIAQYNNRSQSQIQQSIKLIQQSHSLIITQLQHDKKSNTNLQHQSVFYIFKSFKYMKIILIIALVEITTNMYYYGVQFSLEQIGTNFGTNILLTGSIQAVAYFSFSLFVTKLPRQKGLFCFNVAAIIIGSVFLFDFVNNSKILSSVLICLCRFINTYSQGVIPLLQNQSFPSTLQSTGWGLIEGISQLGSFMTPFIVSLVTNLEINPILVICAVMLVFGLGPIKFIKQTLKTNDQQQNQENQDENTKQSLLSKDNTGSSLIST